MAAFRPRFCFLSSILKTILIFCLFDYSCGASIRLTPNQLNRLIAGTGFGVQCAVEDVAEEEIKSLTWWRQTPGGQMEKISASGRVSVQDTSKLRSRLIVQNTTNEDKGLYFCKLELQDATQTQANISVSELFEKVVFSDAPVSQHPTVGENGDIRCFVTGSPFPTITWKKGDTIIDDKGSRPYEFQHDRQVLRIPNYSIENDDGIYECNAFQDDLGMFEIRRINVTGYAPPKIAKDSLDEKIIGHEDAMISLTCTAFGTPSPTFQWFRGTSAAGTELGPGKKYELSENGGMLQIKGLVPDDDGSYTCSATNIVGQDHFTTYLQVLLKPTVQVETEALADEANKLDVACKYSGDDITAHYWEHNDKRVHVMEADHIEHMASSTEPYVVESANEMILTIPQIKPEQAGKYICVVENKAGANRKPVNVRVRQAPTATIAEPTGMVLRQVKKNTMNVRCEFTGTPDPELKWTLGGKELYASGSHIINTTATKSILTITFNSAADFGKYACEADNGVGNAAKAMLQIVEAASPLTPVPIVNAETATYVNVSFTNYDDKDMSRTPDTVLAKVSETTPEEIDDPDLEEKLANEVPREYSYSGNASHVKVGGLEPNKRYAIQVAAKNIAGESGYSVTFVANTGSPTVPEAPIFVSGSDRCGSTCILHWFEPESMGAPISRYLLRYRKMQKSEDGSYAPLTTWSSFTHIPAGEKKLELAFVEPSMIYEVEMYAENSIGRSTNSDLIFATSPDTRPVIAGMGLGKGTIVTIVILLILAILIIIDVVCYKMNHCGLLMCVCVHCCGKPAPNLKTKEIAMEEGKMKPEDKQPLKDTHDNEEADKEKEAHDEKMPMIKIDTKANGAKDTTV